MFDELSAGIRRVSESAELSDFPTNLFDDKDETTAEIKAIHAQAADEWTMIVESLGVLADTVEEIKAVRKIKIESSLWYRSVLSSDAAYDNLVKEYEEKHSQLSISLYGEWVQRRNQLQQQIVKLESIRKETVETERQISETLTKLLDLRGELLGKRNAFLNKVIGDSAFVRMELVQFGDVSTLDEEYRSLLGLGDGKFVGSIADGDSKKGILWDLLNWEDLKIQETDLPTTIATIKTKTLQIAKGQLAGQHGAFDNRLKKQLEMQPSKTRPLENLRIWRRDRLDKKRRPSWLSF